MNKLRVDFVCPTGFENLAAEISLDGQLICRFKSERSDELLEIEFFFDYREPLEQVVLPLEEFVNSIGDVKNEIHELRVKTSAT